MVMKTKPTAEKQCGSKQSKHKSGNVSSNRAAHKPLKGRRIFLHLRGYRGASTFEQNVKLLGATVEKCFSKEVEILITTQGSQKDYERSRSKVGGTTSAASPATPSPFNLGNTRGVNSPVADSPSETTSKPVLTRGQAIAQRAQVIQKGSGSTNIIDNARKLGVKIFHIDHALKYVERETSKVSQSDRLQAKARHADEEKSRKSKHKVKRLRSKYIKFESETCHYRPIIQNFETFPHVDTSTPLGACPFERPKGGRVPADVAARDFDRAEREERDKVDGEEDDNALKQFDMESGKKQTTGSSYEPPKIYTKGELRRIIAEKMRADQKRGYCESCNVKYEDIDKHVRSDQHKKFARNNENYLCLDELINQGPNMAQFLSDVVKYQEQHRMEGDKECSDEVLLLSDPGTPSKTRLQTKLDKTLRCKAAPSSARKSPHRSKDQKVGTQKAGKSPGRESEAHATTEKSHVLLLETPERRSRRSIRIQSPRREVKASPDKTSSQPLKAQSPALRCSRRLLSQSAKDSAESNSLESPKKAIPTDSTPQNERKVVEREATTRKTRETIQESPRSTRSSKVASSTAVPASKEPIGNSPGKGASPKTSKSNSNNVCKDSPACKSLESTSKQKKLLHEKQASQSTKISPRAKSESPCRSSSWVSRKLNFPRTRSKDANNLKQIDSCVSPRRSTRNLNSDSTDSKLVVPLVETASPQRTPQKSPQKLSGDEGQSTNKVETKSPKNKRQHQKISSREMNSLLDSQWTRIVTTPRKRPTHTDTSTGADDKRTVDDSAQKSGENFDDDAAELEVAPLVNKENNPLQSPPDRHLNGSPLSPRSPWQRRSPRFMGKATPRIILSPLTSTKCEKLGVSVDAISAPPTTPLKTCIRDAARSPLKRVHFEAESEAQSPRKRLRLDVDADPTAESGQEKIVRRINTRLRPARSWTKNDPSPSVGVNPEGPCTKEVTAPETQSLTEQKAQEMSPKRKASSGHDLDHNSSQTRVKLKSPWRLASNRSLSQIFDSEGDQEVFEGFNSTSQTNSDLPSTLSFEEVSEVDMERDWVIEDHEPGQIGDMRHRTDLAECNEVIPASDNSGDLELESPLVLTPILQVIQKENAKDLNSPVKVPPLDRILDRENSFLHSEGSDGWETHVDSYISLLSEQSTHKKPGTQLRRTSPRKSQTPRSPFKALDQQSREPAPLWLTSPHRPKVYSTPRRNKMNRRKEGEIEKTSALKGSADVADAAVLDHFGGPQLASTPCTRPAKKRKVSIIHCSDRNLSLDRSMNLKDSQNDSSMKDSIEYTVFKFETPEKHTTPIRKTRESSGTAKSTACKSLLMTESVRHSPRRQTLSDSHRGNQNAGDPINSATVSICNTREPAQSVQCSNSDVKNAKKSSFSSKYLPRNKSQSPGHSFSSVSSVKTIASKSRETSTMRTPSPRVKAKNGCQSGMLSSSDLDTSQHVVPKLTPNSKRTLKYRIIGCKSPKNRTIDAAEKFVSSPTKNAQPTKTHEKDIVNGSGKHLGREGLEAPKAGNGTNITATKVPSLRSSGDPSSAKERSKASVVKGKSTTSKDGKEVSRNRTSAQRACKGRLNHNNGDSSHSKRQKLQRKCQEQSNNSYKELDSSFGIDDPYEYS